MGIALITGVAGFLGAHLAERLLAEGHTVRGIDNFDPFYARAVKEANLAPLRRQPGFVWQAGDLNEIVLDPLLEGVAWVFHLAARPGVRRSWGEEFAGYARANILATQRLLEAVRVQPVERLVFASSSSVYGEVRGVGRDEQCPRRPLSPYGVSKLAGEGLMGAYRASYDLPLVTLRYFTVYGPRQRPDMAFHRFLRALLRDEPLEVYGDGEQTRDFTFVGDAVEATLRAAQDGASGSTYNVGGGSPASVREVIAILEQTTGHRARVRHGPAQPGDPRATLADTARARTELGFRPGVTLAEGLARMTAWMRAVLESGAGANDGAH